MGAQYFTVLSTNSDVLEAFKDACTTAAIENGYDGYTGTVAEKREYTVIEEAAPMALADALALAHHLSDADDPRIIDKWGPAGAIPISRAGGAGTAGWLFFGWASS